MNNSQSHLLEKSILPVTISQRSIGALSYVWIWIGMAVIIAVYSLGATGIVGMSLSKVFWVIVVANFVLAFVMSLTADIGTEHGLSFAVYLRAPFGIYGAHIPSVSRGVVAAAWFGIQTYLGALALNGIFEYLVGFENWIFWYVTFGIVQVVNTAMGIKAVEKLAALAAPAIIATTVWMYFTLKDLAELKGINIWTFAGSQEVDVLVLFITNMSFWSALAVDIPNITRFLEVSPSGNYIARNKNIFLAQFIALPITQATMAFIGAISFMVAGNWNPIDVIQVQGSGTVLIVLLILVLLAQWSTNNAANLIPAALTFISAAAPRLSYKWAVVVAGVVGTMTVPWLILDHLFKVLGLFGAVLSAMGGIMICDYLVIRRRKLNVPDLYSSTGQFLYAGGFNPAGLISWVIGGGLALYFSSYAYVIGFSVGLISYWILAKFWIFVEYPQAEIGSDESKYLATSQGRSWVYMNDGFKLLREEEIPEDLRKPREDM